MSVEALVWAKKARTGNPTRKVVLMILADYADDEWSCFPGQATIAEQAEVSERTVRSVLQQLQDAGFIRRERRTTAAGYRTSDRIWLTPQEPPAEVAGRPSDEGGLPATHDSAYRQAVAAHRGTPSVNPQNPVTTPGGELTLLGDERPAGPSVIEAAFARFWRIYPRRAGKGDARRAFTRAVGRVGIDTVLMAAQRYAADPNQPSDASKIPHPATWLNQERWDDDPLPVRDAAANGNAGAGGIDRLLALSGYSSHHGNGSATAALPRGGEP